MSRPKKQFLGCVGKYTPPEYKIVLYNGLRNSAYEKELNACHTTFSHYKQSNSVKTTSWNEDTRNIIRRQILQAAENSGDVTDEDVDIEDE
ncbi:hypothetical protein PROFUN_03880 [Planoprotostelium fungivorum]|uniref:Uncharacterized protein n=1 Tax=Planoprotostelium fungivorum TaxID=1890364 RepID=A0A2P6MTN3_9EUKA|nr:hypothetical protein PROFUN_03880 [Planoprotostelium fungivorum]